MIATSDRGLREFGQIFSRPMGDAALVDRLLHHAIVAPTEGNSFCLRGRTALIPEDLRNRLSLNETGNPARKKRQPGRTESRKQC